MRYPSNAHYQQGRNSFFGSLSSERQATLIVGIFMAAALTIAGSTKLIDNYVIRQRAIALADTTPITDAQTQKLSVNGLFTFTGLETPTRVQFKDSQTLGSFMDWSTGKSHEVPIIVRHASYDNGSEMAELPGFRYKVQPSGPAS